METLWLDALSFDTYGSFLPETQFVREMGQGYLMEDAVGCPGAPASTSFTVTQPAHYRIFLRTKNWLPDYTPDSLIVSVDGVSSSVPAGTAHIQGWHFAYAGDFVLGPGHHRLSVASSKGWFGRFAAVVITSDMDYMPSPEESRWKKDRLNYLVLPERDVTSLEEHPPFDLVVVGAGPAGIVAAIAASRLGLMTALITDRPVLGGNGSEEVSVALEGATHRGVHERGIILEIKLYRHHERCSWSEAFRHFVDREKNLTVYTNLLVTEAETRALDRQNKQFNSDLSDQSECFDAASSGQEQDACSSAGRLITRILAADTRTLKPHAFSAPLYIDATGDGWLGYAAGAVYRVGREAAWQHGEPLGQAEGDGYTMSGCVTRGTREYARTICSYDAEATDAPISFSAPAWAFRMPEGEALSRDVTVLTHGEWWLENRNDYDDLWESEVTRDALIRLSVGYFDWLKNSWSGKEKAANLRLKKIGTFNGKRETRRLIGDYIMTQNDFIPCDKIPKNELTPAVVEQKVLSPITFPDTVAYTGWAIDVHHVDGIFSGKESAFFLNQRCRVTPIPFRSLYSKNIANLMMAGRNISVTHLALGPTRVMLTGALMGQAVGTAASLCQKYHIFPRQVGQEHIQELQILLDEAGVWLPKVRIKDPADIAEEATTDAVGDPPASCEAADLTGDSGVFIETRRFPKPRRIREIILTFDLPYYQFSYGLEKDLPPMPKVAESFTISLLLPDGSTRKLASVTNNYQYRQAFPLDPPVPVVGVKLQSSQRPDSVRILSSEVSL